MLMKCDDDTKLGFIANAQENWNIIEDENG